MRSRGAHGNEKEMGEKNAQRQHVGSHIRGTKPVDLPRKFRGGERRL